MTDDKKCDSPKRGVKSIREVSQMTERCNGYEGGVRSRGKVWQLSGSVTVLRRFVSRWGDVMIMGRSKRRYIT